MVISYELAYRPLLCRLRQLTLPLIILQKLYHCLCSFQLARRKRSFREAVAVAFVLSLVEYSFEVFLVLEYLDVLGRYMISVQRRIHHKVKGQNI